MVRKDIVVLVDPQGHDLCNSNGLPMTMEKMEAHRKGILHRAVSVFIFNDNKQLMLQRRALSKYHSPGKWTNTCCTHPQPGEKPLSTANRRLKEEMGLACLLEEGFTFTYKADVGEGLIENEYDHVFWGHSNESPHPDPAEVCDWKWMTLEDIQSDMAKNPENYTVWFRICFPQVQKRNL